MNGETLEPTGILYAICGADDIAHRQGRAFDLARLDSDGSERPWPIFVVRWGRHVFGYVNSCPHQNVRLDWERNQFFDSNGTRLMCGKHGGLFELDTGLCIDGPCHGHSLEPVDVRIVDGDICVVGVTLAEDAPEEEDSFTEGE